VVVGASEAREAGGEDSSHPNSHPRYGCSVDRGWAMYVIVDYDEFRQETCVCWQLLNSLRMDVTNDETLASLKVE
jgi:hypothetical protein